MPLTVCLLLVGLALVTGSIPAGALDLTLSSSFEEEKIVAPVIPAAMVLPLTPSTRPPTPVRKPEGKPDVVQIRALTAQTESAAPLQYMVDWFTKSSPRQETPAANGSTPRLQAPAVEAIAKAVKQGETRQALNMLSQPGVARTLSVADFDRLRVKIAAGFLGQGELATAQNLARATLRRSGADVPMAGWVAGLSAWRMKDYNAAMSAFAVTAASEKADDWTRAGAAFWAGRAADAVGRRDQGQAFRRLAAQFTHTFYGLLAIEQLGQAPKFHWDAPAYQTADADRLAKHPLAKQAFDHVANGRMSAADQMLQQIARDGGPELRRAALGYAMQEGLPATALKLARTVEQETGVRYDAAYYPFGKWVDDQDYRVDRALIHAIIRQESGFNPNARSGQGAVGLMQLMPSTANYVVQVRATSMREAPDLTRTLSNLDVGQHYIEHLMDHPSVGQDLLKMLIAYNAGPGNLAKWQNQFADVRDPLLFIETIPSSETRAYVERVMASYWIYRDRLNQSNPTLARLAEGHSVAYALPAQWSNRLKLAAVWP